MDVCGGVDDGIVADFGSGLDDGGGDPGPEGWVVGFQDGGWDSLCHRVDVAVRTDVSVTTPLPSSVQPDRAI